MIEELIKCGAYETPSILVFFSPSSINCFHAALQQKPHENLEGIKMIAFGKSSHKVMIELFERCDYLC